MSIDVVMMGARKAQSFPCPANESQATSLVDEICEAVGNYHSKDMITLDNGADKPGTVLCGYHELRRHMAQARLERERLAAAGSGGPGGWW